MSTLRNIHSIGKHSRCERYDVFLRRKYSCWIQTLGALLATSHSSPVAIGFVQRSPHLNFYQPSQKRNISENSQLQKYKELPKEAETTIVRESSLTIQLYSGRTTFAPVFLNDCKQVEIESKTYRRIQKLHSIVWIKTISVMHTSFTCPETE